MNFASRTVLRAIVLYEMRITAVAQADDLETGEDFKQRPLRKQHGPIVTVGEVGGRNHERFVKYPIRLRDGQGRRRNKPRKDLMLSPFMLMSLRTQHNHHCPGRRI